MNKSIIIAVVLALVAVVWLATGEVQGPNTVALEATNNPDISHKENTPLFKVKTKFSSAVEINDVVMLNGEIKALRNVDLRSEIDARVSKIFFRKGDRIRQGQALVQLNLGDLQEQLTRAKADLKARQSDIKATEALKKKNLISDNQYQQDVSNLAAAEASVKEIEVQIENATIRAPFEGVINELPLEIGDYASTGTHIATIVDNSGVKIVAQVPQQHVSKIAPDTLIKATLLNGESFEGTLSYLSSQANPTTRTFTVEAIAPKTRQAVYFGQSAKVELNIGKEMAHKLSPSTLDLDTDGNLQVKLFENNKVNAQTVEIIRSEKDGLWLKGLPNNATIITTGQGFVSHGQEVMGVPENELEQATDTNATNTELPTS